MTCWCLLVWSSCYCNILTVNQLYFRPYSQACKKNLSRSSGIARISTIKYSFIFNKLPIQIGRIPSVKYLMDGFKHATSKYIHTDNSDRLRRYRRCIEDHILSNKNRRTYQMSTRRGTDKNITVRWQTTCSINTAN